MDYSESYKSFQDRYLNKIEIGYRLPGGISLEETWEKIVDDRKGRGETLALRDEQGKGFWYVNTKPLQAKLHLIDSRGKDTLYRNIRKEIENELIFDSLIEEAWASNLIEGAFTTHKRAQELVRRNLSPRDKNDLMVKNNHTAMNYIVENRDVAFGIDLILQLHRIITQDTLDDHEYSGKFRNDDVFIRDKSGSIIFNPMKAESISPCLNNFIEWVNAGSDEDFIHPIVKASIVHFYMAYVHPFFDGNGRTARALFYFYLLKNNYDFFKYFSISALIAKQKEKYYKAIKDVEDYNNDLTYFLLYSADIVLKSIDDILDRIIKKYHSIILQQKLDEKGVYLNKRQKRLLKIIIDQDHRSTNTRKYQKIFRVAYGTARSDLNDMVEHGLLRKHKVGKGFVYIPEVAKFIS
jgi:Fic family protein